MEISTIQSLLTKQQVLVQQKRILLKKQNESLSNDLTSLINSMGFENCKVSWDMSRTTFMMPRKDTSWTHDITIYTHEKYKTYKDGEVPTVVPELSWSSSSATQADTENLEHLRLLGAVANDFKNGGMIINTILANISTFKQYGHDMGWDEATTTLSDLEQALRKAEEAKKNEDAMDVIREGAEFLVLKRVSKGRSFWAGADTAVKITKLGRKNLHVVTGQMPYMKKRNANIDWSHFDSYMSIDTFVEFIKDGSLLPC